MTTEVEKIIQAHFWLRWAVWRANFKSAQKWKKSYGLTFCSSEPFWELISEFYMRYTLWYIKIDRFHEPSIIHCDSMSKMSVFGVVCCNCPQRFTSGSLYTSFVYWPVLGILNLWCVSLYVHGFWDLNENDFKSIKLWKLTLEFTF